MLLLLLFDRIKFSISELYVEVINSIIKYSPVVNDRRESVGNSAIRREKELCPWLDCLGSYWEETQHLPPTAMTLFLSESGLTRKFNCVK